MPARRAIALLPLVLAQCLNGSVAPVLAPVHAQPLAITVVPVPLYAEQPQRRRLGALTYLGGWALTSNARWLGGLSSLVIDGQRAVAVSDAAALVSFRIGRFGRISGAQIAPVPAGCSQSNAKYHRDTESLAHDPGTGRWWVGYEWSNSICRLSSDLTRAERSARPASMQSWRRRAGAETMLRLRDGRFMILAEAGRDGGDPPLLIAEGDPTDPATRFTAYRYRAPDGFNPTDAAQLPDGRILVLNRRFTPFALFTARVTLLDPIGKPGSTVRGRTLAAFEPPAITENFEGMSVTVEDGRTIVWLISDDNYMRWQRTLLLKFALTLPLEAERPALSL